MRVILTHNNADFDAIASLLALHKLEPTATPVLPERLHRNVENFLTLYAGLLPAVHFEDLQPAAIEYIYLVDTQKHALLKPTIPTYIIDHHPLKVQLAPEHLFAGEVVGATTTLLTERLQREDMPVTPLEATFLSLGIYEDTGSFTYSATTVRDIRAAAWLLERGAKLDIVRDFLSHPLADEQWDVYNRLRESAKILEVQGHSVLVATAAVEMQVASLSTVAHQLANLYDPNAMLVLVQMGKDVQLIARSGVDQIDVGDIARRLGGGGHSRAAAALIHHTSLEGVVQEVVDILGEVVTPSVTVADLMSTGRIETIAHDATAAEAARLMQVSGHEGYPVLDDDGRVIGLLTRRAVDRATGHKLGQQRVEQIMEAGTGIFVRPYDGLETLRQRMMDTGWGQMPVLDDQGRMVGIVTRTDLIRRWGERPRNHRHQQLMLQQLQQALPGGLWTLVQQVAREAQESGVDLYLVGGLVRDLLLGASNLDIDFVVEGDAIGLVRRLCAKFGGDIRYHLQFGTAKWLLDRSLRFVPEEGWGEWPAFLDFATARAEFYKEPTALPTVRQSSIKQDLHRRDFTINSMAIRLAPQPMGDLIDYYNGERDLNNKVIRVLHSLSFVDDATRIIRAVRFEQRLGFQIEPRTEKLLREAYPLLERVTGERIRNELEHILNEPEPLKALTRLDELGVLRQILPGVMIDLWFSAAYRALLSARKMPPWVLTRIQWDWGILALLTLRLSETQLEAAGQRLLIPRSQMKYLESVQGAYRQLCIMTERTPPSEVVAVLEKLDESGWLALWAAMPLAELRRLIVKFVTHWRFIKASVDGRQLIALGVRPGPALGAMLRELRRAWLDGEIINIEQEKGYIEKLIRGDLNDTRTST